MTWWAAGSPRTLPCGGPPTRLNEAPPTRPFDLTVPSRGGDELVPRSSPSSRTTEKAHALLAQREEARLQLSTPHALPVRRSVPPYFSDQLSVLQPSCSPRKRGWRRQAENLRVSSCRKKELVFHFGLDYPREEDRRRQGAALQARRASLGEHHQGPWSWSTTARPDRLDRAEIGGKPLRVGVAVTEPEELFQPGSLHRCVFPCNGARRKPHSE